MNNCKRLCKDILLYAPVFLGLIWVNPAWRNNYMVIVCVHFIYTELIMGYLDSRKTILHVGLFLALLYLAHYLIPVIAVQNVSLLLCMDCLLVFYLLAVLLKKTLPSIGNYLWEISLFCVVCWRYLLAPLLLLENLSTARYDARFFGLEYFSRAGMNRIFMIDAGASCSMLVLFAAFELGILLDERKKLTRENQIWLFVDCNRLLFPFRINDHWELFFNRLLALPVIREIVRSSSGSNGRIVLYREGYIKRLEEEAKQPQFLCQWRGEAISKEKKTQQVLLYQKLSTFTQGAKHLIWVEKSSKMAGIKFKCQELEDWYRSTPQYQRTRITNWDEILFLEKEETSSEYMAAMEIRKRMEKRIVKECESGNKEQLNTVKFILFETQGNRNEVLQFFYLLMKLDEFFIHAEALMVMGQNHYVEEKRNFLPTLGFYIQELKKYCYDKERELLLEEVYDQVFESACQLASMAQKTAFNRWKRDELDYLTLYRIILKVRNRFLGHGSMVYAISDEMLYHLAVVSEVLFFHFLQIQKDLSELQIQIGEEAVPVVTAYKDRLILLQGYENQMIQYLDYQTGRIIQKSKLAWWEEKEEIILQGVREWREME